MSTSDSNSSKSKWTSPIVLAVSTGLIGLLGTGIGALVQGYNEANLERQKFEAELILKALEPESASDRKNYLLFLVNIGLVKSIDKKGLIEIADNEENIPRSVPNLNFTSSHDFVSSGQVVPGNLEVDNISDWKAWGSAGGHFAASREFQGGRILAFGHDDALGVSSNNRESLKESFNWLVKSGPRTVALTAGHCEWMPRKLGQKAKILRQALDDWGYSMSVIPGRLTDGSFENIGVLVVGNAWTDFNQSEIEAVRNFVSNGGGLLVVGLGWSWRDYSITNHDSCSIQQNAPVSLNALNEYPMNKLLEPYGIRWTGDVAD
jgi:hypothetical protein